MFQMKQQNKIAEKELNKTEMSKLLDKESKVIILRLRLLTKLRRRMDEQRENFSEDIGKKINQN